MAVYSAEWEFKTSPTLPQPKGKVGTNTGGWSGANQLIISAFTRDNLDASAAIKAVAPGDQIKLELRNNPSGTNSSWSVTAAPVHVESGNYYTIAVTNLSGLGTPAAGNPYLVTLTTESLPYPAPENALYWILSGSDLTKLQANADKLVLQGFAPCGGIAVAGTTTLTYSQSFWRQNSAALFVTGPAPPPAPIEGGKPPLP